MRCEIQIIGATKLKNLDYFGKSDPYCICQVHGAESSFQTEVQHNNLDPTWNHTAEVEWDGTGDILFKVMDSDQFSADDVLGSAVLHAEDIRGGFEGKLPLEPGRSRQGPTGSGPCVQVALQWRLFQGC